MSYRVLIVEDMPELLDNVCDFFLEEGADLLEVIRCSDGDTVRRGGGFCFAPHTQAAF